MFFLLKIAIPCGLSSNFNNFSRCEPATFLFVKITISLHGKCVCNRLLIEKYSD